MPPCDPGHALAISSDDAAIPDSGKPDARPFAVIEDVGFGVEMLTAPELSGPPEAGLHLVDHQQDAVLVGAFPQPGEEPLVGGHVAALAEHRLDEERGGVGGRRQGLQRGSRAGRSAKSVACSTGQPKWVGSGNGATCTPAISGEKPERNLVPDVVSEAAATVRPWKPPWKTMTLGRPVAWRASRSAASTASLPELAKNIRSRPGGSTSPSRSTSVSSGRCMTVVYCAVDQRADLPLRGLDHPRVAVSGAGHADAGGEIEVAAVVLVVEQTPSPRAASTPVACLRICESCADAGHDPSPCLLTGRLSTISVSDGTVRR